MKHITGVLGAVQDRRSKPKLAADLLAGIPMRDPGAIWGRSPKRLFRH